MIFVLSLLFVVCCLLNIYSLSIILPFLCNGSHYYKDTKREGLAQWWREDGIIEEEEYLNGNRYGYRRTYDEKGSLQQERLYVNDTLVETNKKIKYGILNQEFKERKYRTCVDDFYYAEN